MAIVVGFVSAAAISPNANAAWTPATVTLNQVVAGKPGESTIDALSFGTSYGDFGSTNSWLLGGLSANTITNATLTGTLRLKIPLLYARGIAPNTTEYTGFQTVDIPVSALLSSSAVNLDAYTANDPNATMGPYPRTIGITPTNNLSDLALVSTSTSVPGKVNIVREIYYGENHWTLTITGTSPVMPACTLALNESAVDLGTLSSLALQKAATNDALGTSVAVLMTSKCSGATTGTFTFSTTGNVADGNLVPTGDVIRFRMQLEMLDEPYAVAFDNSTKSSSIATPAGFLSMSHISVVRVSALAGSNRAATAGAYSSTVTITLTPD
ncbi:hypothetical protein LL965_21935 [Xanthomonas cassavae CFBP 4642]|uniref:Fimbrial protein n=1 Tax=Xanthomonas cassavae CFBP 4642 TaxID=1219375 RepID=A0ABS8HK58_9XANT|nr:hypothetical protein [Xanthomonas cassavae]MCC4622571.1 hypothetical protein [Xanthomonas cassavae CFBP 4642]